MRLQLLFLLLPALALSCKESGKDHVDASSLSSSEVLSGMRNTLVKSKHLLHTLETTLRTFIVELETQIEVDSQQLEQAIRMAQGKCKNENSASELIASTVPFTDSVTLATLPNTDKATTKSKTTKKKSKKTTAQTSTTTATTTTTSVKSDEPSCHVRPISENQYPGDLANDYAKYELAVHERDGYYWLRCEKSYEGEPTEDSVFIGKMGKDAKSFTFGGQFYCDENTNKWITYKTGYEAPPFMSCGTFRKYRDKSLHYVVDQRHGHSHLLTIWPGGEQYCAEGQQMQFVDGTPVKSIAIVPIETTMNGHNISDPNGLKIVVENGSTIIYSNLARIDARANLTCISK